MTDSLGDRMKEFEGAFNHTLPIRMPVIIRLDGSSFSSYTRGLKKPIDQNLIDCMNETMIHLCKNIRETQIAYCQSDEVTLFLNPYKTHETQPWFGNKIQKLTSISAGLASAYFSSISGKMFNGNSKLATFDSRAFVLPKEEVNNVFLWRQQDATRNSIQMLARSMYSHKECHKKNTSDLQEMCFQKGINWNDCPTFQKRGRCAVKVQSEKEMLNPKTSKMEKVIRNEWVIDNEIPIFSKDKDYIEKYV